MAKSYRRKEIARRKRVDNPPDYTPVPLATDRDSWERQPDETDKAFAAFAIFRDLDPIKRNKAEAYRAYCARMGTNDNAHKQPSMNYSGWFRKFRWEERSAAYDAHLDAKELVRYPR